MSLINPKLLNGISDSQSGLNNIVDSKARNRIPESIQFVEKYLFNQVKTIGQLLSDIAKVDRVERIELAINNHQTVMTSLEPEHHQSSAEPIINHHAESIVFELGRFAEAHANAGYHFIESFLQANLNFNAVNSFSNPSRLLLVNLQVSAHPAKLCYPIYGAIGQYILYQLFGELIERVQFQLSESIESNQKSDQTFPQISDQSHLLSDNRFDDCEVFSQVELSKEHPALARAIIYLKENHRQDIGMQKLAEECFISASHLSSLLKQRFSMSFKKILTHLRVESAKKIIASFPHRQITLICNDCGFSDLSHFEKTFKRYVGKTPGQFRKQIAAQRQPLSIEQVRYRQY